MCVASEKERYEVVYCSNCGSEKIKTKWVAKYRKKTEPHRISVDEKIENPPERPSPWAFSSCGDCSVIEIPVQVVMWCEECGYTVTKTIEQEQKTKVEVQ